MRRTEFLSASEAATLVRDGDTIVICGCENVLLPDELLAALGQRFEDTGSPRDLTEIHPIITGMGPDRGLEHLARPGMVRCAIGSGFSYLKTSKYTEMLKRDAFAAHVVPMGTLFQMLRGTAAGQPYTWTRVGLGTFADPEVEGGCMNSACLAPLSRRETIGEHTYLSYSNPRVNIAILRGSTADEDGNISLDDEPVSLGVKTIAQATHNSGGKVIVQVRRVAKSGTLHPRMIEIPGIMVDAVVVEPEQSISGGALNSGLTGQLRVPEGQIGSVPPGLSRIIASRAAEEVEPGAIINLGVGMPIEIPKLLHERGRSAGITFFPEHGSIGGIPGDREIFGTNINPEAIIDSTEVFDFYRGGGLDVSFLGFGQIDACGNVNVSKFNGIVPGCGGFIDIIDGTRRIVFCGSFTAGGLDVATKAGGLRIKQEGKFSKFVPAVEQITFAAKMAASRSQTVRYVTERAVFTLQQDGLQLDEIADGVELNRDVLSQIPFEVRVVSDLRKMAAEHFD
ncbi:MAG: CoA-transferase [Pseudomonadota bacterium]